MSRYIDADALLNRMPDDLPYKASVKRVVMQAPPADVVEVVRCKDCKHCIRLKDGGSQCERIDGLLMTKPTDYCSYGKRREQCEIV